MDIMKTIVLLISLALAGGAWAQAPKPAAAEPAKPAAQEAAKRAAGAKGKVKFTQRRFEDARRCLEQPTNDAIIKCSEEYL
jgi:hypothetical protein